MRSERVSSYDPNAPRPEVGSVWVWEIDQPTARELIRVTEVFWNGEEWWVRTDALRVRTDTSPPASHLNDLSRFWEACTPVGRGKEISTVPCPDCGTTGPYHGQAGDRARVEPKPWPGYCQSCGAVLDPPDARRCRACGRGDEDERGVATKFSGGDAGESERQVAPARRVSDGTADLSRTRRGQEGGNAE